MDFIFALLASKRIIPYKFIYTERIQFHTHRARHTQTHTHTCCWCGPVKTSYFISRPSAHTDAYDLVPSLFVIVFVYTIYSALHKCVREELPASQHQRWCCVDCFSFRFYFSLAVLFFIGVACALFRPMPLPMPLAVSLRLDVAVRFLTSHTAESGSNYIQQNIFITVLSFITLRSTINRCRFRNRTKQFVRENEPPESSNRLCFSVFPVG